MVPKMLSYEQKEMKVNMAKNLIDKADEDDSSLKKIVTDNETCCFLINPQTKRQSSEWKAKTSPRKKSFVLTKAEGKCDEAIEGLLKKWIPGLF
ncbi:uncharacterized protein TNCV_2310651 [Trichonephila clavipes]|nr:uncharacterized protein TNCV_2310651 [Trichonephila clavipes]